MKEIDSNFLEDLSAGSCSLGALQIIKYLVKAKEDLELARSELEAEEAMIGIKTPPRLGDVRGSVRGDPTFTSAARLSDARNRVVILEHRVLVFEDSVQIMLKTVPVSKWEFVVRCRYLYGWDMQAIANKAKISKRTAYTYMRRATEWMDTSGASASAFEFLRRNLSETM